jgi:lipid A ethanolaminephosphotransferase
VENADAKVGNKQPYCFGNYCQDEILLDGLDKRLAQITSDSVIVLHTMGSHGPTYYKRYPERFKKFLPECATRDIQRCSKEEIVNTYDNTILYTDFVVSEVIEKLKAYPQYASAMIYISDHGESLGEGNLYLHGVPYAVAPDVQKKIPFLFWANEPMKAKLGLDWERFKTQAAGRKASHDNLFSSVLGVLDVQSSAYQPALDVFSRQD